MEEPHKAVRVSGALAFRGRSFASASAALRCLVAIVTVTVTVLESLEGVLNAPCRAQKQNTNRSNLRIYSFLFI